MSTIENGKLHDDDVCARCRAIPWDELTSPPGEPKQVVELHQSHERLKSASCRICRCLAKIKPSSLDGKYCFLFKYSAIELLTINAVFDYKRHLSNSSSLLYVYSDSKNSTLHHDTYTHVEKNGALGIFKTGHHYDVGIQPTDPNIIPFPALRDFKTHCRDTHLKCCVQRSFLKEGLSGFRVIDCKDPRRAVTQAPTECRYAALSYVWGNVTSSSSTQYPRVVEDAIIVTLSMGLQYLWVDAYCIDQNSASDKHHQISQMGNIYANSEITFIAAAGMDMSYGLPGVSRPRRQQGTETINGVTLLEAFPHTFHYVHKSAWASRGWTFQEAVLSPRRLIFTDNGVSFLCNEMYIAEWEKLPLRTAVSRSALQFRTIIPCDFDSRRVNYGSMQIYDYSAEAMFEEYSRRQLSYESDALKASLGFIKMLEGMNLYSLWGVLINRSAHPQLRIHWYHKTPTKRRQGFPSWSYLGWEGQFDIENNRLHQKYSEALEVSIGDYDKPHFGGKQIRDLTQELKGLGEQAPRYLYLKGPMVDVTLEDIQWTDEEKSHRTIMRYYSNTHYLDGTPPSGLYASLKISAGVRILVRAYVDEANLKPGKFVGSLYAASVSPRLLCGDEMLLFQNRGRYYERVGALSWDIRPSIVRSPPANFVFAADSGELLEEVRLEEIAGLFEKVKLMGLWSQERVEIRTIVVG